MPTGHVQVSGVYPHLAVTNGSEECGIGAVVPWGGRLWFLTYPPHKPNGSDDKLYWLDGDLTRHTHTLSVGGTHACRMVHPESSQLILGPYVIARDGSVRVIPPAEMPGRLTAVMRHLAEPERLVYFLGMEGELYEVDVHTLVVKRLYGIGEWPVPGTHAKGGRTGGGRVVVTNNGDRGWQAGQGSGALAEWDGATWTLLARTPFTEVSGPDGMLGGLDPADPVWTLGWDDRSVLLRVLADGVWTQYRLPKGSYTHDALHGWYTEWPRIRDVGADKLLAHMHGLFWEFPRGFRPGEAAGIRPLASYQKMPVDYCAWDGRLVMAANDASRFDNPFAAQPDSNLWYGTLEDLRGFGAPEGWGGLWRGEDLAEGQASDPFLIAGFRERVLHLAHRGPTPLTARVEIDESGTGHWRLWERRRLEADGYRAAVLPEDLRGEWLRLVPEGPARGVSAYLHLANPWPVRPPRGSRPVPLSFEGLAVADDSSAPGGVLLPSDGPDRYLWYRAGQGLYRVDETLRIEPTEDAHARGLIARIAEPAESVFSLDAASVVIALPEGDRLRLPRSDEVYDRPFDGAWPRSEREVVTERSLLHAHGTFYELPRPDAGGLRRIRPICTHGRRIADFCSWRGMLVLAGARRGARADGHTFVSTDGRVALWFGNVDDLWRLGKPVGTGGPWRATPVEPGVPSDPYLMTGYDAKRLILRHDRDTAVRFLVEVDFDHAGWHTYAAFDVPSGEPLEHVFPRGYRAHWVRVTAESACRASAEFTYS